MIVIAGPFDHLLKFRAIVVGRRAAFIFCNSVAGLLGNFAIVKQLPSDLPIFAVAVFLGAILGTTLSMRWQAAVILKALGLVLFIAGLKLIGVY